MLVDRGGGKGGKQGLGPPQDILNTQMLRD